MFPKLLAFGIPLAAVVIGLWRRNEGGGLRVYHNPIISGFAPDPSCIRVDDQYFCVTSSFATFPGIPVYTSRDLVQWKQIGDFFFVSTSCSVLFIATPRRKCII